MKHKFSPGDYIKLYDNNHGHEGIVISVERMVVNQYYGSYDLLFVMWSDYRTDYIHSQWLGLALLWKAP